MTKSPRLILLIALLLALATGACRRNERRYDLKGTVVLVEKDKHLATIAHDEVKGLMPAMTMPFTVPDDDDLNFLAPDDEVTATLVVDGSQSWLENLFVARKSAAMYATISISDQPGASVFGVHGGGLPVLRLVNTVSTARQVADALRRSPEFRSL